MRKFQKLSITLRKKIRSEAETMVTSGGLSLTKTAQTLSNRYKCILKKQTVDLWKRALKNKPKKVPKKSINDLKEEQNTEDLASLALNLIKKNWNQRTQNSITWQVYLEYWLPKKRKSVNIQQTYIYITMFLLNTNRKQTILKTPIEPPMRKPRERINHPNLPRSKLLIKSEDFVTDYDKKRMNEEKHGN